MISRTAAFDRVLAAILPDLTERGFELLDAKEHPEGLGRRYAVFGDGRRVVRLTWEGGEGFFVLEGDADPRPGPRGQPIWVDLTLQRYYPLLADDLWVAEVSEDVRSAFLDFAD
jgi:hypothetical protein